jgi:hypothetical protein
MKDPAEDEMTIESDLAFVGNDSFSGHRVVAAYRASQAREAALKAELAAMPQKKWDEATLREISVQRFRAEAAESRASSLEGRLEAAMKREERAVKALGMVYDKWEDGNECWEDPDDFCGYLGKAFKFNDDELAEVEAILALAALDETGGRA